MTSVLPWPLHRNGGAQRTELIRLALLESGYEVDVVGVLPDVTGNSTLPEPNVGVVEILRYRLPSAEPGTAQSLPRRLLDAVTSVGRIDRTWRLRYSPQPAVAAAIRGRIAAGHYSHVLVRYLQTALVAGVVDPAARAGIPLVADLDDVDWLTLQSRFQWDPWSGLRGWLGMRRVLATVRDRTERALEQAQACFVASEEDRRAVEKAGASAKSTCRVLPNLPFPPDALEPVPLSRGSRRVLFVGDLQFPPNRHGLGRFLAEAWPLVRAKLPHATLAVVGRGLAEADAEAWGAIPGVELIGFVEDLEQAYREAAVVVAPIWWGGGTKIKVLEALSYGRGCVTTTSGARGYGPLLDADCGLVAADAPEAMAHVVGQFLDSEKLRIRALARGPAAVREHFSFERFCCTVAATLDAIRRDRAAD